MGRVSKIKTIIINIRLLQGPYTGVQSYVYNLVKHLILSGKKYHFRLAVSSYQGGNQYIDDLLSRPQVELVNITLPEFGLPGFLFDHVYIYFWLKRAKVYLSPVNILPFFKNKKTKYLVGVLDLCTFIVPQTTTKSLKLYYDLFLRSSLSRADKIITISQSTKIDVHQLFRIPLSRIQNIPLGVDKNLADLRSVKQVPHARESFSPKTPYFLCIGSSKRKNLENTLLAYNRLRKTTDQKVYLVIVVGDPTMIKYINTLARTSAYKQDIFLTRKFVSISNLSWLYRHAMALVYCSYYEGFGLPILEAMINHCAVIAANNSSLPEVVGSAGVLVDPYNPEAIASAMETILVNKKRRLKLVNDGAKRARKFAWSKTANTLLSLINRI